MRESKLTQMRTSAEKCANAKTFEPQRTNTKRDSPNQQKQPDLQSNHDERRRKAAKDGDNRMARPIRDELLA